MTGDLSPAARAGRAFVPPEPNSVDATGLGYLLRTHYLKPSKPLRACHPCDLVDEIVGIARYLNIPPALSRNLIDRACRADFVEL